MKKINSIKFLLSFVVVFAFASCDKGFVDKNQNPYALTNVDPGLLFSTIERNLSFGGFDGEQTIVQQWVLPFNLGATTGFNFNADNDSYNPAHWNQVYGGPERYAEQIISIVKSDPAKVNLYNMTRILRAYQFMVLVDTYGDVPYSEAGKAYIANITTPKYDKSVDIYADIYAELKAARAALTTSGAAVPTDFIYGGPTATAAVQIPKWQRLAGSLMLRLGMRYTKLDPVKAQAIVTDAMTAPGVMTSTADNMLVPFNTTDTNPLNAGPRGTNPYYYYLAEPFVNQLKTTKDPRSKYLAAMFANPNTIGVAPSDTTAANQFGVPVGYDQTTLAAKSDFRGVNGAGFKYTQMNYNVVGNVSAPLFYVTYAQTQLLLAEAAFRGFVPGGTAAMNTYYSSGIRASMDEYTLYPNAAAIPVANSTSYTAQPLVAITAGNELKQINTQYWIASFCNGAESFANFRRSGFPALSPNTYNTNITIAGGFVRRFPYPNNEISVNTANYQAAVASMGGDDLNQRVFWDK